MNLMTDDGKFIKSLFRKQSSLNILAMVTSVIGPIVCMILAGTHYGSEGLAIMAICSPLFLAAGFFGVIISGGAHIICSENIAKDDLANVNKVYSMAIILTLAINVVVTSAMLMFQIPILTAMGAQITPELSAYYQFFILNAFATMFVFIPLFFSRVVGRSEIGIVLTGTMAAVSIAASLVLIQFMGIEAIALGQAIGAATGFAVSMVMLRGKYKFILPQRDKMLKSSENANKEMSIKRIFILGSPLGLTRLYNLLATLVLNALFLRVGGTAALAVYGVVATLHRFCMAGIDGVAQTAVPLVGVFHREQDITSVRQTMRLSFLYGNGLVLALGLLLNIFSTQIEMLFGLPVGSGLNIALLYYAVYALLLLNTTVFSAYYNASQRLGLANTIPFFQEFALLCAAAFALTAVFGINGIWIAFPLSGAATLLILLGLLLTIQLKSKRACSLLLLQDRRALREGRYISFSVPNDPEKASEAAARISEFCEENEVSPKQTMLISMSVEEIITLIIYNSKNKNFSVSVRLFLLDDSIILRIRNTGEKFDAIEYYKANIADDIEKSLDVIGMKYIVESANNIYYRQTFGVNSLVVVL